MSNKFIFGMLDGIMNTSGLLQSEREAPKRVSRLLCKRPEVFCR